MGIGDWTALQWVAFVEQELLLFAGIFFLLGALDELAIDAAWLWLRLTGRTQSLTISRDDVRRRRLSGSVAILIPAWHEERVIGHTIAHALRVWTHREYIIYVGCYRNDARTMGAAMRGAGGDPRVRLVVHDRDGPSTKADCLNRLYRAMEVDEHRLGTDYRMVMIHDAEDMVDPAEMGLVDSALDNAEFVQIPVLPEPQPKSRWIGSHYCEEFAEAHGKAMVVRDMLGASLPAAGVGCAFDRAMLRDMARLYDGEVPFSTESLTEDYELGMKIEAAGGRSRFIRVRGEDGRLVATRAYFPARLEDAVRQKARWVHGIALQGWDRLGWEGDLVERWMRLRDRRGPLSALVLACGYAFFLLAGTMWLLDQAGLARPWESSPLLSAIIALNLVGFAWRALIRFSFTTREYGLLEGVRAVLRIPVANIVAIMAGRRALGAYVRTLFGARPIWDKTAHHTHPAAALQDKAA